MFVKRSWSTSSLPTRINVKNMTSQELWCLYDRNFSQQFQHVIHIVARSIWTCVCQSSWICTQFEGLPAHRTEPNAFGPPIPKFKPILEPYHESELGLELIVNLKLNLATPNRNFHCRQWMSEQSLPQKWQQRREKIRCETQLPKQFHSSVVKNSGRWMSSR